MSTFRRALLILFSAFPLFAAFPTGWTKKCPVVIQHTQVTANQTNFPIVLTTASFLTNCAEIVTAGGPAQSDGGDLRISSDAAGATQLPLEVVVWSQNATPASAKVELWTPTAPSSSADVTIYIWYSAGGAQTQPAVNAAFGRNAVWSADGNFQGGVAHMQDGSVLTVTDATGINTYTNAGLVACPGIVDGCGGGNGLTQSVDIGLLGTVFDGVNTVLTVEYWINGSAVTSGAKSNSIGNNIAFSNNIRAIFGNDGAVNNSIQLLVNRLTWANNFKVVASVATTLVNNTWYHVAMVLDVGTLASSKIYVNGASVAVTTTATGTPPTVLPVLGSDATLMLQTANTFQGAMDEVRISNVARSATWIGTEYNNMNSPGTFAIAGAPIGGGSTNTPPHGRVM